MTVEIQQLISRIGELRDAFHTAVYADRDLDAALRATEPDAGLVNLPMGTGTGPDRDLRRHLGEDVLPHLPADLGFRRVGRTTDQRSLVQESIVEFTHDRELPWLLPGIAATHRHAKVVAVTTVRVRHRSRMGTVTTSLTEIRTLWDLAGLTAQLGLDPRAVPLAATG